ncbi:CoA transferase, partial [Thermodesulfobacteriota bacterium]
MFTIRHFTKWFKTAFGTTGPWKHRPAFDVVIQAVTGMAGLTGEPDGHPMATGASIADISAGVSLAHGVLAA